MNDKEWLEQLKEGDDVLVVGQYGSNTIGTVARRTATQIIVQETPAYQCRYYAKNGNLVGRGQYSCSKIREATPEIKNKLARRASFAKLNDFLNATSPIAIPSSVLDSVLETLKGAVEK